MTVEEMTAQILKLLDEVTYWRDCYLETRAKLRVSHAECKELEQAACPEDCEWRCPDHG